MIESHVQAEYEKVWQFCQAHEPEDPNFVKLSGEFRGGYWRDYYYNLLNRLPTLEDKVVVDFGCKYGHVFPLFLALGAVKAIGVEVEQKYLRNGSRVFGELYGERVEYIPSENGYIALQPESVDIVVVNEVVSHINPGYLDTVYAEIARILKTGGLILISDGNNLGVKNYFRDNLCPLYEAWENGPDRTRTDRDVVSKCFLNRRVEMICQRHPLLEAEKVKYLAENTSGLFGDYFLEAVDRYVQSGELIRRPYRKGVYPTNPSPSGVVMERGFYPLQVEMALRSYGFETRQLYDRPRFTRFWPLGFLKDLYRFLRYYLKGFLAFDANWERHRTSAFQILGVKTQP